MLLIIVNTKWYERFLEFFCSSIVVFEIRNMPCGLYDRYYLRKAHDAV